MDSKGIQFLTDYHDNTPNTFLPKSVSNVKFFEKIFKSAVDPLKINSSRAAGNFTVSYKYDPVGLIKWAIPPITATSSL